MSIAAVGTHAAGCVLYLRVVPNAARTVPAGFRPAAGAAAQPAQRLLLRVHAPPVDGKANREVLRWAADFFGVALSHVELLRGEKGREKDVLIHGMRPDAAAALLAMALPAK